MAETLVFFEAANNVSLGDVAARASATLRDAGQAEMLIASVAPIEAAPPQSLTFIDNPKYLDALRSTKAAAVLCNARNAEFVPDGVAALVSDNPYRSFALAAAALFPTAMRLQPITGSGLNPGACVDETAQIEDGVTVEFGAVVGAGACIGSGSVIGPNAVIGPKVQIGRDCSISAGATVLNALLGNRVFIHCGVRIGSDGFGFAMGPQGHLKIPQIGRVVIQDDVEIGANSCIDRGSNRDTIIGEGTKIDDLVMIGHNVTMGCHCVIVSQTGIAGSAQLGDFVVLGGKAAINGHVKVGSGAQIAGLSGVGADVPPGVQWGGVPARPIRHWMREVTRLRREAMEMDAKRGGKKDG